MASVVLEPLYACSGTQPDGKPCGAAYHMNPKEKELALRSAANTWGWRTINGKHFCGVCVARMPN